MVRKDGYSVYTCSRTEAQCRACLCMNMMMTLLNLFSTDRNASVGFASQPSSPLFSHNAHCPVLGETLSISWQRPDRKSTTPWHPCCWPAWPSAWPCLAPQTDVAETRGFPLSCCLMLLDHNPTPTSATDVLCCLELREARSPLRWTTSSLPNRLMRWKSFDCLEAAVR